MSNPINLDVPRATHKDSESPQAGLIQDMKGWELILALICIFTLIVMVPRAVKAPLTVIVNCKDGESVTMASKDFDPANFKDYCDF